MYGGMIALALKFHHFTGNAQLLELRFGIKAQTLHKL